MSNVITDYEMLELILSPKSKTGVSMTQDMAVKILGYVKDLEDRNKELWKGPCKLCIQAHWR